MTRWNIAHLRTLFRKNTKFRTSFLIAPISRMMNALLFRWFVSVIIWKNLIKYEICRLRRKQRVVVDSSKNDKERWLKIHILFIVLRESAKTIRGILIIRYVELVLSFYLFIYFSISERWLDLMNSESVDDEYFKNR